MSFPTNLFVDSPEMQDVSLHALGEDIEKWPEELVQKFKERVPDAESMSILVKFMKKDEENGSATGSLLISDNKKQAVVPVIVKDFMLFPLDVFFVDKHLLPLTPDYFRSSFNSNEVFQKLEEYPAYGGLGRFEDSNLFSATYPPSMGRYAYASAGYPILDAISDTIDPAEFKTFLKENPGIAIGFQKHGHAELIRKIVGLKPMSHEDFRKSAERLIPRDVVLLRKVAAGFEVLANSTTVFSPIKSEFGPESKELPPRIVPADLNEVKRNGEKIVAFAAAKSNQVRLDANAADAPFTAKLASEFGTYTVLDKNGVEKEGWVVPTVIDFDMEKVAMKLFLGKSSTLQTEIAGIRKEAMMPLESSFPQAGQTGCFVYHNGDKALATVPVQIKTAVDDRGDRLLKVADLRGNHFQVKLSKAKTERIAKVAGQYHLPTDKFEWYPMKGFEEVSDSVSSFQLKTASVKTANPVLVAHTGHGRYFMRGVDKYASACGWNKGQLEGYQVKFLLASLGADAALVDSVMTKAANAEYAEVRGLNRPPLASEKIAAAVPIARKLVKVAQGIRCNLVKQASFVENSQTVDTLLSLNFVNPDNISKFVGKIPALKSTISHLASLLIASRIGIKEIPEHSTSTAMVRLIDVVNGLEALRATQDGANK